MGPVGHGVVSLCIGTGVWALTRSKAAIPAAIATGVFTDLDHLYDYHVWHGKHDREHTHLFLHGWEYTAIGFGAAVAARRNPVLWAAAFGHLSHMIGDQTRNSPSSKFSYSFMYRKSKGFRHRELFDDEIVELSEGLGRKIPFWSVLEPVVKRFIPWL